MNGKIKKSLASLVALACVFALLPVFPVVSLAVTPVPAFPEADGAGKYAKGGRGGIVYEVTTLEDGQNIPGSLRAAIEAEGPRTVIFKVAGTIELQSKLKVKNPYLTVAGQTAPGEGITLKNYTFGIEADDVIVRNIRVRYGDLTEGDAMSVSDAENVAIDHCSVSWGVDETLSVTDSTYVTVQWSFITEGLHDSIHHSGEHSKGSLISGSKGQVVSVHHNLYAHNDARNPRVQGKLSPAEDSLGFFCDITNNVMYDWGREYAVKNLDDNTLCTINLVNNYFIAGPSSNASNFMIDRNQSSYMYFSGNYMNGKKPEDQYSLITYEDFVKPEYAWKLSEPFDAQMTSVQDAETAYAMILKNGGAAINRDTADERIVNDVLNGTGRVIDAPADVGGWPSLETGEAYIDTDRDGMPDDWELQNGFNPQDALDGTQDADTDGYTNLEEYLNGLMSGLYTEETEIPQFHNDFQRLLNLFYQLFRSLKDVRHFFEDLFAGA